jgi:hypothetical protein
MCGSQCVLLDLGLGVVECDQVAKRPVTARPDWPTLDH